MICEETPNCVAFNENGKLRSATQPLVRSTGSVVWIYTEGICVLVSLRPASHIGREPDVPIWPMPKSYTRGDETVGIDYYSFHFVPNQQHPDMTAAIHRYMDEIFGDNVPAPAPFRGNIAASLSTVNIDVEDYNVQLNVRFFSPGVIVVRRGRELHADDSCGRFGGADRGEDAFWRVPRAGVAEPAGAIQQLARELRDPRRALEHRRRAALPGRDRGNRGTQHRGMLIDSVRHFLPLRVVKKIIDSLTYAKFNALHWHLSDNEAMVLQTRSAPRFWDSAYTQYERYTQHEMREIVEYARQRGVRVIPEIDVPGHMKSWCTVCRAGRSG